MSGQRPPTNTRASWGYNYSEGQHPTEDLLLAFVRHQHLDNRIQTEEIEQHIKDCPFCRHQCRTFEQDGRLVASHIQERKQQFYPSITNQVMQRAALENSLSSRDRLLARFRQAYKYSLLEGIVQKVRGQQQARGEGAGIDVSPLSPLASEPLPAPFAALQDDWRGRALRSGPARVRRSRLFKWSTAAALIVVAAVFTLVVALFASPALHQGPANHVQPPPLPWMIPQQRNTPTTTKAEGPVTPTKTPIVNTEPQIWLCSMPGQSKHNIIQICGNHFTPGGRVWLAAYGGPNVILPRTADRQGNVDITFTLYDCRAMPALIIVVDASSHREVMLSNLSLSGCQPSRHR